MVDQDFSKKHLKYQNTLKPSESKQESREEITSSNPRRILPIGDEENYTTESSEILLKIAKKFEIENSFSSMAFQGVMHDENLQDLSPNWESENNNLEMLNVEQYKHTLKYPSLIKPHNIEDVDDNNNNKIKRMMSTIDELEERISININLLEDEKSERLKIQDEMCSELTNDKNGLLFLNLCKLERNLKSSATLIEEDTKENESEKKPQCQGNETNKKDFIRRNIELASTAMSKMPFTDEEKQQLEKLLADIDSDEFQQNCTDSNEGKESKEEETSELVLENAFHLSETDKQRISTIDIELENNFSETQNLRTSNHDGQDNFWKSLILDQMLEEIDQKLTALKKEDEIEEISLTKST